MAVEAKVPISRDEAAMLAGSAEVLEKIIEETRPTAQGRKVMTLIKFKEGVVLVKEGNDYFLVANGKDRDAALGRITALWPKQQPPAAT